MFKRITSIIVVVCMLLNMTVAQVYAVERKQVGGVDPRIEEQLKADLGIDKATKILSSKNSAGNNESNNDSELYDEIHNHE